MRLRDRPLLVDGIDADLYVRRPEVERELLDRLQEGRNVILTGPRGSGKSTLLRAIVAPAGKQGQRIVVVSAGAATDTGELLALIALELELEPPAPAASTTSGVIQLVQSVRGLGSAAPATIALLDPHDPAILFELFGRLREELWALPHQWLVEAAGPQRDALRRPPAEAFFPTTIEMPPLDASEVGELLRRGLDPPEQRTVLASPRQVRVGYPREVIQEARRALNGTLEQTQEAAIRRYVIAESLGRAAHLALAEIEGRGAPVSGTDEHFLKSMGWTRPHAARTLASLERAGALRSFDETRSGPGRPRKLYEPNPNPPA